jgi:ribosomal protein S18 acetylase RimI-like enzyme
VYFVISEAQLKGLFRALGHPEWAVDEQFSPGSLIADRENWTTLGGLIADAFEQLPTAEIIERLHAEDVPCGPILGLDEVHLDAQIVHNNALVEWDHPVGGRLRQPRPGARFSVTTVEPRFTVPGLGEDTAAVLNEHERPNDSAMAAMTAALSGCNVRAATASDLSFVKRMLYEAANRPGDEWPPFEDSMREPRNVRFWRGFPRAGDVGVVAEDDGAPVGAAWIRAFSGDELGPVDDAAVPVLAIGVAERYRGRGIGGLLIQALLAQARGCGVQAIDLTTGDFNEAAVRLYHSSGFQDVARFGDAIRMRLILTT